MTVNALAPFGLRRLETRTTTVTGTNRQLVGYEVTGPEGVVARVRPYALENALTFVAENNARVRDGGEPKPLTSVLRNFILKSVPENLLVSPIDIVALAANRAALDAAEDGRKVPSKIRQIALEFCSAYGINGVCDPMYICNVIAMETELGDGQGNFEPGVEGADLSWVEPTSALSVAGRLVAAYGSSIERSGRFESMRSDEPFYAVAAQVTTGLWRERMPFLFREKVEEGPQP